MPTHTGQLTLLAWHAPLMTNLAAGCLRIVQADGTHHELVVGEGLLLCARNVCRILADDACHSKEIDESTARAAKQRAEQAMQVAATEPEVIAAKAALAHALAQLRMAEARRRSRRV